MAFPRQEHSSPRALPYPGIQPPSPALAGGFFTAEPPGKPHDPKSPNFRGKASKVRAYLQLNLFQKGWHYSPAPGGFSKVPQHLAGLTPTPPMKG